MQIYGRKDPWQPKDGRLFSFGSPIVVFSCWLQQPKISSILIFYSLPLRNEEKLVRYSHFFDSNLFKSSFAWSFNCNNANNNSKAQQEGGRKIIQWVDGRKFSGNSWNKFRGNCWMPLNAKSDVNCEMLHRLA